MTTEELTTRIAEIQQRADAATEGPWHIAKEGLGNKGKFPTVYATNADLNYVCQCADGLNIGPTLNQENAAFIAHARQDVPWLVATLAKHRKAVERAMAALKKELHQSQIKDRVEGRHGTSGRTDDLQSALAEIEAA